MKSVVIIDGSNFYHKLKSLSLKHLSSFDFESFIVDLTKNTELVGKYYCIGKIQAKQNDSKARLMMAKQQKLLHNLKSIGFHIQLGYLLKSNALYHEKGTDVQIAVNLMKGAYNNEFDVAYLVSSDSDLIPAISEVRAAGKSVVYVGFMHQPSFALLKSCTHSRLLEKNELMKYTRTESK